MASAAPPKGYSAKSPAVWGTDMERNAVTVDSGRYSVEFLTQLRYLTTGFIPAMPSTTYRVNVRYSSDTIGTSALVKVEWYTAAQAAISTNTVTSTVIAADTWEELADSVISPATAGFYKLTWGASFVPASDTFYISKCMMGPGPDYFSVGAHLFTQSIPNGAWTTVEFPSLNLGGSSYQIFDHTNDRFTPSKSKPMLFNWAVGLNTLGASKFMLTALFNNSVEVGTGTFSRAPSTGTGNVSSTGSRLIGVKPGDNFYIKVLHDHGSDRNTTFTSDGNLPLFSAHEIGF